VARATDYAISILTELQVAGYVEFAEDGKGTLTAAGQAWDSARKRDAALSDYFRKQSRHN
jgi:Mn-dependent DtxR family transcriptional regulator